MNKIKEQALKWIFPSIENRSVNDADFCFRIEKAKEKYKLPTVSKDEIIKTVNTFLKSLNMPEVTAPRYTPRKVSNRKTGIRRIEYSRVWEDNCPEQNEKEDIVWIKFTEGNEDTDNCHISVVGVGCDISFTDNAKNTTSAGRIIKALELEWDDFEILIFPLKNIPSGLKRSDIESGIGNYLLSKGVPILDYYSHNF